MPPPNILWICTDQQRYDSLRCYGNGLVTTPNLDQLAAAGVLFEQAYCQSPVCAPSRASFLTGRYPRTTRLRQNGQALPPDEVLVTRLLAEAGYLGGLAGKLHLSACHPKVCPTTERRIDDGYTVFNWSHHPDPEWPGNEYGSWLEAQGLRYERRPFGGSRYVQTSMAPEHHHTTWCADRAIDFIEQTAGTGRPWFCSVNFFDPHHPFDPPLSYLERYLDRLEDLPPPNYMEGELSDKPPFQQLDHQGAYNQPGLFPFAAMNADDHRLIRAAYLAMVVLIDEQVGRLRAALERTGQAGQTLVIAMSDHGEMLGDHGLYLKGPYFYEPAIRVPLLVAWPGVLTPARRSGALVELVDLAPTLLEAAGLPRAPGMQGRSLWPLLTGQAKLDEHRDDVYCEYYHAMPVHQNPPAYATMLRTRRHKLAVMHRLAQGELYDLEQDPGENLNRWNDPACQATKAALLQRLTDRMAWTIDPLPAREAGW